MRLTSKSLVWASVQVIKIPSFCATRHTLKTARIPSTGQYKHRCVGINTNDCVGSTIFDAAKLVLLFVDAPRWDFLWRMHYTSHYSFAVFATRATQARVHSFNETAQRTKKQKKKKNKEKNQKNNDKKNLQNLWTILIDVCARWLWWLMCLKQYV